MTDHAIEAHFDVETTCNRAARIDSRAVDLMAQATGCEHKFVEDIVKIISVYGACIDQATKEMG